MSQPMIDVQNLVAAYGPVQALQGVSLAVERGEIFGLLGPNGAGMRARSSSSRRSPRARCAR